MRQAQVNGLPKWSPLGWIAEMNSKSWRWSLAFGLEKCQPMNSKIRESNGVLNFRHISAVDRIPTSWRPIFVVTHARIEVGQNRSCILHSWCSRLSAWTSPLPWFVVAVSLKFWWWWSSSSSCGHGCANCRHLRAQTWHSSSASSLIHQA